LLLGGGAMTDEPRARDYASRPAGFEGQLAAAREGNPDALGRLLQGCRRYLLLAAGRALESSLRPKEGASDLVQQTFVVAQRDFQTFRGNTLGELLAWLNRILEHQLSKQVRYYKQTSKRNVRREVPLDAGDHPDNLGIVDGRPAPGEHVASADEQRRVRAAIEQLPDDYKQVLVLRTWQRLPFAEIGQRMGRSAGAAEKLWLRAVERLQAALRNVE
jgi:RNA polymerase sigma-70 factor (ECF subfamily)